MPNRARPSFRLVHRVAAPGSFHLRILGVQARQSCDDLVIESPSPRSRFRGFPLTRPVDGVSHWRDTSERLMRRGARERGGGNGGC